MITVKWKYKNSKPLSPQPLGMFWSISRNRIITLFFVVRWVMFKPVFVAAPAMALWNCHLFIQHRLYVDSWTVVFLSHARPLTHRCGRGVNFRVQISLCGLCGGKEGRYHKEEEEEEEDGIGCRFGNKDKETLESFSVVYLVHTTFPFPPSFPSVSLILSHQKWSCGKKGEEFSILKICHLKQSSFIM